MDDHPRDPVQPVDHGQMQPRRTIPEEASQVGRNIKAVVWALVLVGLVVLIFQNWNSVPLDVFFWSFHVQLTWILLAAVLVGILLGWLVPIAVRRKRKATKANQV